LSLGISKIFIDYLGTGCFFAVCIESNHVIIDNDLRLIADVIGINAAHFDRFIKTWNIEGPVAISRIR